MVASAVRSPDGRAVATIPPPVVTTAKRTASLNAETMLRNVTKAFRTGAMRRGLHVVAHLPAPKFKVHAVWSLCVFLEMKYCFIRRNLSVSAVSVEATASHNLILKVGQESLIRV